MYCRKCGIIIPDDSVFCLKCGTKVEVPNNTVVEQQLDNIEDKETLRTDDLIFNDDVEETNLSSKNNNESNILNTKTKYGILVFVGIVIVLFIIVSYLVSAKKCKFSGCNNTKQEGSKYCSYHTCKEDDCTSYKSKNDSYCYTHEKAHACTETGCDRTKLNGGEYCYEHTCIESGCYNKRTYGSSYCKEHQIDMSKKLGNEFYFRVNSAGGIELIFFAKNNSGKEIKYIRFNVDLYNAVGDKIKDEIKNTSSVYVEITGPIANGESANYKDIIGYNENCAKIAITEVTLVYMDGTSQTGHYGWYTEK